MNRESKRKLLEYTVRDFEILHQDIKVRIKYQEEFCNCKDARTTVQDTIIKMIKTGKFNWDISTLTQKYYQEIGNALNDPEWGKKYLVNFGDFPWFRETHRPIVFDVKQYEQDMGGIFAGPLVEGRYYSLWFNNRLAQKIGLQIKSTGMTFDDFLGYVKQSFEYNQRTNEKILIFEDKSSVSPVNELFNALVLSALASENADKNDLSLNLKALKRALNAMEKLTAFKPLLKPSNYSDKGEPALEGRVLFSSYVSSIINQWEAANKAETQNMLPAEFPVFETPGMYYHGSYQSVWAVFKNSPHRDDAIKLMQYFCTNDFAEKWIGNTRNPTALKVRLNASDIAQDDIARFNVAIEKKYGTHIRNYDITEILFGPKSNIIFDVTQIVTGEITADDYYHKIIKQLKTR